MKVPCQISEDNINSLYDLMSLIFKILHNIFNDKVKILL